MTEKQHKPGCKANERCLVYHADGVCPGPYGKCTCDTIPDSSYISAHEPIGEKPWETWEERFEKTFGKASTAPCLGCWHHHMNETEHSCACHGKVDYHYVLHPGEVKVFIASEIQSAVEAERRRISEEAAYIESHKAFHCRFDELVKVINPKK